MFVWSLLVSSRVRCNERCMGSVEMEKYPECYVALQAGEDDCKFTDQSSCDADANCTWCKCAAVPSVCYNLTMAKRLPVSVFACDKL